MKDFDTKITMRAEVKEMKISQNFTIDTFLEDPKHRLETITYIAVNAKNILINEITKQTRFAISVDGSEYVPIENLSDILSKGIGEEVKKQKLRSDASYIELVGEGNSGAITVIMKLLEDSLKGLLRIIALDDMNIRGPNLWVAYKDYANEDINKLKRAIDNRSKEMVEFVNKHVPKKLAVECGGSSPFQFGDNDVFKNI